MWIKWIRLERSLEDKLWRIYLNKRNLGSKYEAIAAKHLSDKGYDILEMNYRNSFGEIDIIAKKDKLVVYTEVKYRTRGVCGDPLEAVNLRKQKQISKVAACHYAHLSRGKEIACRFDVVGIYGDGSIKHVENAFPFCW